MKRIARDIVLFTIIFSSSSLINECNVVTASNKTVSSETLNNPNSSKLIKNPYDILVLVNRKNILSPGYIPKDLAKVNAPSVSDRILMRKEAAKALENMIDSARKSGVSLYCLSGYRSYNVQAQLYSRRIKERGKEYTEKYIASAGRSEHQTGLAIDIVNRSSKNGVIPSSFGNTKEGKWLFNNSYKFGFILRYPRGKENITGINYEPWHFRYVGVTAAIQIKNRGIVLEEYLKRK